MSDLHLNGRLAEHPAQCGSCRHWVAKPIDPMNLKDVRGECRAVPPTASQVPTQQGLMTVSAYPNLPREFPACGLYAPALQKVAD